MEYTTLNDGVKIPIVGFGVYLIPASETKTAVSTALKDGYRLIDTAEYYHNEREVGEAVAESGIPRDQVFITSKMPPQPSYEEAMKRIDETCAAIGNDYLDLMLIHWPGNANVENYRALEDAQKAGKVRSIGLSSFYGKDYQEIIDQCDVVPVVDQNETHVFCQQVAFQPVLESHGTKLEAWSPLAAGSHQVFQRPLLKTIARAHHKTTAQVMLRFLFQRNIITIPKSVRPQRIRDNINIFDFELTADEMKLIRTLDRGKTMLE